MPTDSDMKYQEIEYRGKKYKCYVRSACWVPREDIVGQGGQMVRRDGVKAIFVLAEA